MRDYFSYPWRNKKGEIACPGKKKCSFSCTDSRCPISLQTEAVTEMLKGHDQRSILLHKKVLELAPGFFDALVNLGDLYVRQKDYAQAYEYYKKAYDINKTKYRTLYGLALTTRAMNRFDECLIYCKKYSELYKDGRLELLQQQAWMFRSQKEPVKTTENPKPVPDKPIAKPSVVPIQATTVKPVAKTSAAPTNTTVKPVNQAPVKPDLQNVKPSSSVVQNNDLADTFLKLGSKLKLSGTTVPDIPHILQQANELCSLTRTILALEATKRDVTAEYNVFRVWCVFVGMGATAHWLKTGEKLDELHNFTMLTSQCGIFEMDEFVLDMIGIKFNSEAGKELCEFINTVSSLSGELSKTGEDDYCLAMYKLGMSIAFNNM